MVLRVDFDTPLITLTNMIPYAATNDGAINLADAYRFVVSSNSVRAQFEINNPGGDMSLVVRKSLPLPTLASYDYISTNSGTSDELIIVFTNSVAVPLSPGDWYLSAINESGGPLSYSIKASEWTNSGRPITITGAQISGSGTNLSFCITWDSLVGAHYYVEGVTDLSSTNWAVISPTITAVDVTTSFCVALPSPYHYFRVVEGFAPAQAGPPTGLTVTPGPGGFLLQWAGPVTARYQVQWKSSLTASTWNTIPDIITSTTGQFTYLDDGSQTGGLSSQRFYRIMQVP